MAALASLGGQAVKAKFGGQAFEAADIKPIESIEDAKEALDDIRVAIMSRRLTHAEGNAASKTVAEWVKAEGAAVTQRLITELRTALEEKTDEIEALRKQLNSQASRPLRVTK